MKPILIVGAGPTGLVLALWLHSKNIPFRIVDKAASPGETSRALAIQTRTLEFYRQLGIADDVLREGLTVHEVELYRNGKRVARAPIGSIGEGQTAFPYIVFLSQDVHERILVEKLRAMGIEVERSTELVGFEQDQDSVTVRLQGPRGAETAVFDWLCGCDGAHSRARKTLGIGFPGGTYSQVFFVTDVIGTGAMANGKLGVSLSYDDFCIVMPVKSLGSMRLTGIVPPDKESKETISFEDVKESIVKNTGLRIEKVNWFSSYHVHHRVADSFRQGRVFLAGDAGHIHSPAGGQGMNTGIGDAVNLAWKLAAVVSGNASAEILETYAPERVSFARRLVASTDRAFTLIASRTFFGSIWRRDLLPRLFATITRSKAFLKIAFRTISQTRIKYRKSALSQGRSGSLRAGDRLPWLRIGDGDNFQPLVSRDWQIHVYGTANEELRRTSPFPVHVFDSTEESRAAGFDANKFYLLRPDGHLGLIADDHRDLAEYIRRWGLRSSERV